MIFANVKEWLIPEGYVKKVVNSSNITLWEKTETASGYFYVEDASGSDNTLRIRKNNSSAPDITVYYSTDETNWTELGTTSTTALTTTIPANGKVYLKANADTWDIKDSSTFSHYYNRIGAMGNHNVGGNIMSLLYGDDFSGVTTFPTNTKRNFSNLFYDNTTLVSAESLILPATTLTYDCYGYMFQGCQSLTTAPNLPATTLADFCYSDMFFDCTSLTTAPELPATTLADYCYYEMFKYCRSITTAPELPATTLAQGCYGYMFSACTSLTTPPELPATTLAQSCYYEMFNSCPITTAPVLPATTLTSSCYSGMFAGCRSITTAPELPATTLTYNCYSQMFEGCTSLTTAPVLPATTLTKSCYYYMFEGCSNLNSVTTYADDISATDCLKNWLGGVASTGDFYNNGSATYETNSASGIPTGWTEHKAEDYSTKYFFVEDASGSDNTFSIVKSNSSAPDVTVYYSTDETNWNTLGTTSTNALTTTIPANGRVYLKATTTRWSSNPSYFTTFSASGNFNVGGNIMSLINGDNFATTTSFTTTAFIFNKLFRNVTTLISAEKLILPVLSLPSHCYYFMFQNCTNLVKAPVELPATTISNEVYSFMFYGCSSLTTAPVLYATNLKNLCFQQMFNGCSNLNYIKMLSLDAPNSTYCQNWVSGVASSGTFVKSSSATWENKFGVNYIPDGWTVETADA